ncbi:hypothetical protein F5882DRAFT_412251 [Hyaloscypha sp. PMI_1271]|nr:hypothetical protein F5882DRAFT_412251 [Hyaloscypha sp. PMI_1271]
MFPSGPNGMAFYRDIIDLGTGMFGAAKTNPHFRRDAERCFITKKGEDLLTFCTWEPISENIAGSQQADGGSLICLTMVEALFQCPPYSPRFPIGYMNPELRPPLTVSLIRTARAGKLWLTGDQEEEAECLRLVFCAIRGALVQTSPYCRFRVESHPYSKGPYSIYHSTLKSDDAVKDMMCGEIVALLGYDTQVASLAVDGVSLTTLADKWRVLDIWREALSKAGFEPDTVVGLHYWMHRTHLYGPMGSIFSGQGGASVHLTADISSGRVCLDVGETRLHREGFEKTFKQDPIADELTRTWSDCTSVSKVHCEITAVPVVADTGSQTDKFELFIDYQDLGEPWNQRVAEVQSRVKQKTSGFEGNEMFCEIISPEIEKPDIAGTNSLAIPALASARFMGLTFLITILAVLLSSWAVGGTFRGIDMAGPELC